LHEEIREETKGDDGEEDLAEDEIEVLAQSRLITNGLLEDLT